MEKAPSNSINVAVNRLLSKHGDSKIHSEYWVIGPCPRRRQQDVQVSYRLFIKRYHGLAR